MRVRPVRSGSDRVTGVEPMNPEEWPHPPVDVVLRISGLFRDSLEPLLDLLREARTVGRDARSGETNYLRSNNPDREARIFGNEPEAYGAGLLPLINQGNWDTKSDLSRAFRRWSRYTYDEPTPREETQELDRALAGVEAVTQNCDTREHDILDSDDYFQFHGGLAAAVAEQSGAEPATYVTDTSQAEPEVRTLKEETARVFHSRIAHPVWQEAMREHGYKGAFEMGASLDYLFGYDATTGSIPDLFYDQFARDMVLDEETRAFLEEHNPWSLEEMGERLLESHRRGLWEPEDPDILEDIRQTLRESESAREAPVS
jgi:cobaltochelatase CobN